MKDDKAVMHELADRVRRIIGDDPRVTEKNMFGGLTFLLNGHILVGAKKDGRILLSVGKDNNDTALAREGASQMEHGEKSMSGFVWVEAYAIEDEEDLTYWVRFAEKAVAQRPPKEAKPPKKPAKR